MLVERLACGTAGHPWRFTSPPLGLASVIVLHAAGCVQRYLPGLGSCVAAACSFTSSLPARRQIVDPDREEEARAHALMSVTMDDQGRLIGAHSCPPAHLAQGLGVFFVSPPRLGVATAVVS